MLSERVRMVGASATLQISERAKALKAQGKDVIDLSVGEPDFPTPVHIREAARLAIEAGKTRYTANPGTPELRRAIAGWLERCYGVAYRPEELLVSNGAKHSLYNLVMALVDPGDEVLVPAPYWVSYPEMVKLAGGVPVVLPTSQAHGFRLDPAALAAAVTPRTRLLFLNNPSNPTGAAYDRAQLEALARVVVDKQLMVAADEIYANLVYAGFRFTSFAALGDAVRARTVLINGVSKAFSMTGWRIGFAAGPEPVIKAMSRLQSHATSNACSISQEAARAAFEGPMDEVARMTVEFQRRRDFMLGRLGRLPGVSCPTPEGAFYVFPRVEALFSRPYKGKPLADSTGLALFLLEEAQVAAVPGSAFGAEGFLRLSYATSMENLVKSMDRIEEALSRLA